MEKPEIVIIEPKVWVYLDKTGQQMIQDLEAYGRTCYKSEDKITEDSSEKFIKSLLKRGHLSVIEHEKITARVICDRGVTHEIVRHRIGSYSQESTRYVNYAGKPMQFINPCFWMADMFSDREKRKIWLEHMKACDIAYKRLINLGATPQEARSVLPNSLKTEIVITYNLREWRHFFNLRCSYAAHPQMRQVAKMLLSEMSSYVPIIFRDQLDEFMGEKQC